MKSLMHQTQSDWDTSGSEDLFILPSKGIPNLWPNRPELSNDRSLSFLGGAKAFARSW